MAKDPVCGMDVDEKTAEFKLVKNGKKYYFCSKNCYDKYTKGSQKAEEDNETRQKSSVKKTAISISGMHCASCAMTIEKALKKTKGVAKASVNYASEKASVEFNENEVDEDTIKQAILKSGYKVADAPKNEKNIGETRLKVIGMNNPHCVGTVSNALNLIKGITSKELLINEHAFIKYDPNQTNVEEIKKAIKQAGYEPVEQTTSRS